MKKICLVGKGSLTKKQEKLLKKAIGNFKIIKQIETLTNPNEIENNNNKVDAVVSFLLIPPVVSILNKWQQMSKKDIYLFKIEQIGTFNNYKEMKEKVKNIKDIDIIYEKNVNGEKKIVCSKTVSILKNVKIKFEYEKEINLNSKNDNNLDLIP